MFRRSPFANRWPSWKNRLTAKDFPQFVFVAAQHLSLSNPLRMAATLFPTIFLASGGITFAFENSTWPGRVILVVLFIASIFVGRSSSPSGASSATRSGRRSNSRTLPRRPPAACASTPSARASRERRFSRLQGRLPGTHFPTPRLCGSRRHVSRPPRHRAENLLLANRGGPRRWSGPWANAAPSRR